MEQLALLNVDLPRLVSILHCVTGRVSIHGATGYKGGYVLCLYTIHHPSSFLSTCPCHGDCAASCTISEVWGVSNQSKIQAMIRGAPCRYARHAALQRIPSTSFTFSSSFGDRADIVGAISRLIVGAAWRFALDQSISDHHRRLGQTCVRKILCICMFRQNSQ
jgi:hypothetical protein